MECLSRVFVKYCLRKIDESEYDEMFLVFFDESIINVLKDNILEVVGNVMLKCKLFGFIIKSVGKILLLIFL